jgi:hypothetical protein
VFAEVLELGRAGRRPEEAPPLALSTCGPVKQGFASPANPLPEVWLIHTSVLEFHSEGLCLRRSSLMVGSMVYEFVRKDVFSAGCTWCK